MSSPLAIDSDVTLWNVPLSELGAELAHRPLLVLMHGWGATERDLFPVARLLPPEFVIAAIRAPLTRLEGGYQWQPFGSREHPEPEVYARPAQAVLDWLDAVEGEYGQAGTSTSLLGFSQGGAMVSHLFRLEPARFATGVFLSGYVGDFPVDADSVLAARRPPLFWGRGTADPVVPEVAVSIASAFLHDHFVVTERAYPGLGHGISEDELSDIAKFLRANVLDA